MPLELEGARHAPRGPQHTAHGAAPQTRHGSVLPLKREGEEK